MKSLFVIKVNYVFGLVLLCLLSVNAEQGYSISYIGPDSSNGTAVTSDFGLSYGQAVLGGTLGEQADSVFRQVNKTDSSMRIIGLSMNYTNSNSGYGPGLDIKISIERDNRLLGAGVLLQHQDANIFGGEVFYRHYLSSLLLSDKSGYTQYRVFRFYLQYNFFFRKSALQESFKQVNSPDATGDPAGRVATFEHYAGGGVQAKIIGKLFLNAGIGYGVILGSTTDKFNDEPHYSEGGRKNDYGMVVEFGTGYFFGK